MAEHVRFPRLEQVASKALDETIKAVTLESVVQCYPQVARTAAGRAQLEQAREQVLGFWRRRLEEEFAKIYEERGLRVRLDELDDVVYEARERMRSGKRRKTGPEAPVHFDRLGPQEVVGARLCSGAVARTADLMDRALDDECRALREELDAVAQRCGQVAREIGESVRRLESVGDSTGADKAVAAAANLTQAVPDV